jgi:hypothetical protein
VSTLEHPSAAAGVSLQSTQVGVPGAAHDAPASTPPPGGPGAAGPHETEEALSNPPPARCVCV